MTAMKAGHWPIVTSANVVMSNLRIVEWTAGVGAKKLSVGRRVITVARQACELASAFDMKGAASTCYATQDCWFAFR
jgi:hypothetical protein